MTEIEDFVGLDRPHFEMSLVDIPFFRVLLLFSQVAEKKKKKSCKFDLSEREPAKSYMLGGPSFSGDKC